MKEAISMRETRGSAPEGRRSPTVAVLGAGPVGLDAALAARAEGFRVVVYEAATTPAGHVRSWGHVRLFSPWSMNVSPRMRAGLEELGRPLEVDEDATHTGHELADRVLDPLWTLPELKEGLQLGTRVLGVSRRGTLKSERIGDPARGQEPFRLLLQGPDGREWVDHADIVLDCTGRYGNPNALGDGGIPAPGERALEDRIERWIPDLSTGTDGWKGKVVLLAGSGHSAQTAARDLAAAPGNGGGPRVLWVLRRDDPEWGSVEDDPLPLRSSLARTAGELAAGSTPRITPLPGRVVDRLTRAGSRVQVELRGTDGSVETHQVDRILSLTGGVGDHTLYRQLQVHECYATSGPMKLAAALLGAEAGADCLTQESHGAETLKNPEPDFFILGDKSYGRNSSFLMRVGWNQVDEVFSVIAS